MTGLWSFLTEIRPPARPPCAPASDDLVKREATIEPLDTQDFIFMAAALTITALVMALAYVVMH